jgi:hypothetical protein
MTEATFEAEVRLIRWSESSTAGRTITIELPPDQGEAHPFRGFSTGHQNGQRFRISFVPIDDDEKPVTRETPAKAELRGALLASDAADRHANLSLVGKQRYAAADEMLRARIRAGVMPKDLNFIGWADQQDGQYFVRCEQDAIYFIHRVIGGSRSLIATDPDVYRKFLDLEAQFLPAVGRAAENRG